jgi:RNA polymerase sigma-70 factor (ECF subfamily)
MFDSQEEPAGEPAPELLAACRVGDRRAFERLFEQYKDRVYSVALHIGGDPSEAGDVTQDVFLKLLTRIGQYRGESRFQTWLFRIVVNTSRDRVKARRREGPLDEAAPGLRPQPPGQEEAAARGELSRHVARALAALDEAFRAPLVLRYHGDLSYEEIAQVLGISAGTVASRISRALASLAKELSHLRGA